MYMEAYVSRSCPGWRCELHICWSELDCSRRTKRSCSFAFVARKIKPWKRVFLVMLASESQVFYNCSFCCCNFMSIAVQILLSETIAMALFLKSFMGSFDDPGTTLIPMSLDCIIITTPKASIPNKPGCLHASISNKSGCYMNPHICCNTWCESICLRCS